MCCVYINFYKFYTLILISPELSVEGDSDESYEYEEVSLSEILFK